METPRRPPRLPPRRRVREFFGRVYSKAAEDNIFFMGGAITFNLLIVVVPLIFLIVGLAGHALGSGGRDPADVILPYVLEILPEVGGDVDLVQTVRDTVDALVEGRSELTVVGAVLFVWITTRLVGTLRTVLREVFDVTEERSIVKGKIFDGVIVMIGTVLALVNFLVTLVLQSVGNYGIDLLGFARDDLTRARWALGVLISFGSIWVLFLLIYRYLLVRRIPWRTAIVAATFTAVMHEVLKAGFSVYAGNFANFGTAFGNFATAAILFIWIYYESLVFILGGEVAQVYTMDRVRRLRVGKLISGTET